MYARGNLIFGLRNVNSMRQPPANYLKELIDKINTASMAAHICVWHKTVRREIMIPELAPVRERTFDVGDNLRAK